MVCRPVSPAKLLNLIRPSARRSSNPLCWAAGADVTAGPSMQVERKYLHQKVIQSPELSLGAAEADADACTHKADHTAVPHKAVRRPLVEAEYHNQDMSEDAGAGAAPTQGQSTSGLRPSDYPPVALEQEYLRKRHFSPQGQ